MITTLIVMSVLVAAAVHWHRMSYTLPPGYTLTYRGGYLYGFWVLRDPDGNELGNEIIAAEFIPGEVARNLTRRANAHAKRGGN